MTTLDKHGNVPVELALQLEGVAINRGVSTREMLELLLMPYVRKEVANAAREEVRKLHEKKMTATEIGNTLGKPQQAVSQMLRRMGLTPNKKSAKL